MFKSYLSTTALLLLFLHFSIAQDSELPHDGIIISNLTELEMLAILTPDSGHTVYNTDTNSIWYFDGASWRDSRIDPVASSPFEIDGTTIRQKGGYSSVNFIIGRDSIPDNSLIADNFFFFDKFKGAMRGGELFSSDHWKQSNLGVGSFGWGLSVLASGDYSSIALGHSTEASGNSY